MRVSMVRRQELDTPTYLIKNLHDGCVSKDRLVMADDMRMYTASYCLKLVF